MKGRGPSAPSRLETVETGTPKSSTGDATNGVDVVARVAWMLSAKSSTRTRVS